MRCLHICNDFNGSAVHKNLYKSLSEHSIQQTIYYPIRLYSMPKAAIKSDVSNTDVIVSKPLKKYHRLFFKRKINHLFSDLEQKGFLANYNLIHATTFFSDGALALKIKKKYGIPFIVTVRATDVHGFLKYRKDLTLLGLEILKESEKIIFITPALKQKFFDNPFIQKYKNQYLYKCSIIFNGVSEFWIRDRFLKKDLEPTKLLYVGTLIRRKNVMNLSKAIISLNNLGYNYNLTIVGNGGAYENKVKSLAKNYSESICYKGQISDKNELKKIYRENHIFILPSKSETFGLVYIEALSQGLPIIYLKNESVDGMFRTRVGEISPDADIKSLIKSVIKLSKTYQGLNLSKIDFNLFSWKFIANKYYEIYGNLVEKN